MIRAYLSTPCIVHIGLRTYISIKFDSSNGTEADVKILVGPCAMVMVMVLLWYAVFHGKSIARFCLTIIQE